MNTYVALYRGRRLEVRADTSYHAQQAAARTFGARHTYDVTVMLAETPAGTVTHTGADLPGA